MRLLITLTNLPKKKLASDEVIAKLNSYHFFYYPLGCFPPQRIGFNFSFSTWRSHSTLVHQVNGYIISLTKSPLGGRVFVARLLESRFAFGLDQGFNT